MHVYYDISIITTVFLVSDHGLISSYLDKRMREPFTEVGGFLSKNLLEIVVTRRRLKLGIFITQNVFLDTKMTI